MLLFFPASEHKIFSNQHDWNTKNTKQRNARRQFWKGMVYWINYVYVIVCAPSASVKTKGLDG